MIQDGRVDIQSKNVGYVGNVNRNAGRQNKNLVAIAGNGMVQQMEANDHTIARAPRIESNLGKPNVQCYNCNERCYYVRDCPQPIVLDSKFFKEQMLFALKNELNAAVIMMARIQPTDDTGATSSRFDADILSEVNALTKHNKSRILFWYVIRRIHLVEYGVPSSDTAYRVPTEHTTTLRDPFQFSYHKIELTMEEIVNKFIEEEKREQEKMEAFIKEFRTTNELLLKERNNSLSELEFKIYGLSRAINKAQMVGYEAKGVTTRGGKSTTEPIGDNNNTNKHPLPIHDEPTTPDKIPTNTEPIKNQERIIKLQPSSIPFPHRMRKKKEEAQQRKFLENLKQLHINIPFTEALAQMPKYAMFLKGLLLNKA
ncbi:retrovirus-related pol polyprotein from transposon TNT 1-94 [Tanacetum coccineum]